MRRPDKIFGHRLWMTPVASYVGLGGLATGAYWLMTGAVPGMWAIGFVIATFALLFGVTVGMHRLFCHQSFKTSRTWHAILGWLGTMAIYGSTVQWPAMHASHHRYADTDLDPHYTGWRYLFWKKNRPTVFNQRVLKRLFKDPLHRWLHSWYVLVVLVSIAILASISIEALVFLYLAPLGWLHLVGSLHQVFAHGKDGAKDQPILELLMPTGGEWLHGHHHARPKDRRFGILDIGYAFIRAIEYRHKPTDSARICNGRRRPGTSV